MTPIDFSLHELDAAAKHFLQQTGGQRCFAFYGAMGAGKTTFIKAVCRALGVTQNAVSPTFTLVNEYATAGGEPVYHFDFYRLNQPEEAFDIGCEDYFYSGAYCFVEWAERAEAVLPDDACRLRLETLPDHRRRLTIE
jgi:tRNA threonylcarbamoyladenosine biosynthesis protein TsaE